MSLAENAKKQILNIIELIVSFIIMCLAAGRSCVDCHNNIRAQFVDAVIFGYFIVNCLVVVNIFLEGSEFHEYWRAIVAILGAVLFLIAGALVLDYISGKGDYGEYDSYVTIITCIGVFSLVMVILYIVDAVLILKNK